MTGSSPPDFAESVSDFLAECQRRTRGIDGVDLPRPYEINLWEATDEQMTAIEAPLNPALYGIDPLTHLQ